MPKKSKKSLFPLICLLAFLILVVLFLYRRNLYASANSIIFSLGFNTNEIASPTYVQSLMGEGQEGEAIFLSRKVDQKITAFVQIGPNILGDSSSEKSIEVDLSEQRLYMKEGSNVVGNFLVSTGKWYPTPQGEWRVWTKIRNARMRGGSKALGTFYDLPNVPYTMYYYQGYGIHGAYWHNNFGHPMSHGCVNMKPEEAAIVYNWAEVGTRVIVRS